jgi:DDE superfamily endonuclease/Helix-turn-helix of DDE superfamily endonuclease
MLDLERVKRDDRLLRALTGLNLKALTALQPSFAQAVAEAPIPRRSQQPRERSVGGGRKPRLASVEDKLIYILFYFKCYPTFDLAGLLFDLDRSQANRWMHRLQPVLEAALGQQLALPKRKLSSLSEFVEAFPEVERVIIDATERPVQRAKDKDKQQDDYSGKKKRHTRSHLALVEPNRKILIFSHAYAGRHNDKGILNQEGWAEWIPDEVLIQGDLGFFGLQNEVVNVELPHKKPRGGQLSDEQKADNRALASERVVCEHSFAGLKRYGIAHQVYRNRIEGFDDRSMVTAAGLWNFYLEAA